MARGWLSNPRETRTDSDTVVISFTTLLIIPPKMDADSRLHLF